MEHANAAETGELIAGVDIGGTFTDLTLHDPASGDRDRGEGAVGRAHGPSGACSPPSRRPASIPGRCRFMVHGTTVATNAMLERSGPQVAMITTEGFRDVVELGRTTRLVPGTLYDPYFRRTPPFVSRRDRHVVAERMSPDGESETCPDPAEVDRVLDTVAASGAEAVADLLPQQLRGCVPRAGGRRPGAAALRLRHDFGGGAERGPRVRAVLHLHG